jgi:hypothetical protein
MGSCGPDRGCPASGGCHDRKDSQRRFLTSEIARVYPDGVRGALDDEQAARGAISREDRRRLGASVARALRAPVYARTGAEGDLCDYLYALCVGRHPGLVEVRDGRAVAPAEAVDEVYLRVNLSAISRAACVQEVRMSVTLAGEALVIEERPRDGVLDPTLLGRFQRLIEVIEGAGLVHLDMGMLEKRPEGAAEGAAVDARPAPPTYLNTLFYRHPPTTATTTFHPLG